MSAPFVDRHGLWSAEDDARARDVSNRMISDGIDAVRFVFADQHGILRGKTLLPDAATKALRNGVAMTSTLLAKDTSHRTVFPVFTAGGGFGLTQMQGAADIVIVPDPATFRVLPWARNNALILCDVYFGDGQASPFCTRNLAKRILHAPQRPFAFLSGLEAEFHIYKITDPSLALHDSGQPGTPPQVELTTRGYQYLTEQVYDSAEPILETLRAHILALGLPLQSIEVEFGPSQFEFTFGTGEGIASADNMILFRMAAKEICRRHGFHASFMCRPKFPNAASSGWHLHQSLIDPATGKNLFATRENAPFSSLAQHYLAGLLQHARAGAAFAAPTINAYRRYRPYSLAPDRAIWGRDNRGVMVRLIGGADDLATRFENRIGDPAANPYLYLASQFVAGCDGIDKALTPPPPADTPYETEAPQLPRSLSEALAALSESQLYADSFGKAFVDYFCHIKQAEIARFQLDVTEWEHREYFDLF